MMNDVSDKNLCEIGLDCVVESKLKTYFKALNGDPPTTNLHARIIREVEKPLIALALKHTKGNKVKAAALLGMNRNTLYKKIQELGLEQG
ncbi:MAG: Fis family transcriptional regulator [Caedimonas sp.]|nr:Fis family transcriptional regulator [Caedimonas sp.]